MKTLPTKRKWRCDECGEVYDKHWNAEECWKSHQDPEWPEVSSVSVCGCGMEFSGHQDEACPECKRDMETYMEIMQRQEKAA